MFLEVRFGGQKQVLVSSSVIVRGRDEWIVIDKFDEFPMKFDEFDEIWWIFDKI